MKSFEPFTDPQINELMKLKPGDAYPKWLKDLFTHHGIGSAEPLLLGTLLYYRNLLWDAEDKLNG